MRQSLPTDDMFPTSVTVEEEAAGFVIDKVKNPKGHYGVPFGPPPATHVQAVVRVHPSPAQDGTTKAVKMSGPTGVTYAIWNDNEKPVFGADAAHSVRAVVARYP